MSELGNVVEIKIEKTANNGAWITVTWNKPPSRDVMSQRFAATDGETLMGIVFQHSNLMLPPKEKATAPVHGKTDLDVMDSETE
jgi:hypothetical protein